MQGNRLIQKVIRVLKDNGDCVGHSYLLRYSRAKASEFSDVIDLLTSDGVIVRDGLNYKLTGKPIGIFTGDEFSKPTATKVSDSVTVYTAAPESPFEIEYKRLKAIHPDGILLAFDGMVFRAIGDDAKKFQRALGWKIEARSPWVTRGQLADTLAILTKTHKVTVVDPTTGGQS